MANKKKYDWGESERRGVDLSAYVGVVNPKLTSAREDAAKDAAISAYFKTVNKSKDNDLRWLLGYRMAVNPDADPFEAQKYFEGLEEYYPHKTNYSLNELRRYNRSIGAEDGEYYELVSDYPSVETFLYHTGQVVQGAAKTVEGIVDFGIGGLTELAGMPVNKFLWSSDSAWAKKVRKILYNNLTPEEYEQVIANLISRDFVGGTLGDALEASTQGRIGKDGKIEHILVNVEQNLGQQALYYAVPGAHDLVLFASASGNAMENALNDGGNLHRSFLYGISSGAVETLIENLSGGVIQPGRGWLGSVSRLRDPATGALRVGKDMLGEGAEEVASGLIDPLLKTIYKGSSALEEYKDPAYWADVGAQGAYGALTAGVWEGLLGATTGRIGKTADALTITEHITELDSTRTGLWKSGKLDVATNARIDALLASDYRALSEKLQGMNESARARLIREANLGGIVKADGTLTEGAQDLVARLEASGAQLTTPGAKSATAGEKAGSGVFDVRYYTPTMSVEEVTDALRRGGATPIEGELTGAENKNYRAMRTAFEALKSETGMDLNLVLAETVAGDNGFSLSTGDNAGTVVIGRSRLGGDASVAADAWMATLSHEVFHFTGDTTSGRALHQYLSENTELFGDAVESFLRSGYLGSYEESRRLYNAAMEKAASGAALTAADTRVLTLATDELGSIMVEKALGNRRFAADLIARNSGAVGKLIYKLRQSIEALRTMGNPEAKRLRERFRAAEQLFLDAATEAGYVYRAGTLIANGGEDKDEGEVRYSKEKTFSEQIDDVISGEHNPRFDLYISETPKILTDLNFSDGPLLMRNSKISEILKKHPEMSTELLKKIPDAISDPTLILKSKTNPEESVVIVTNVITSKGEMIVPVWVNQEGNYIDVELGEVSANTNFVASAYGRNIKTLLEYARDNEGFLYQSKDENRVKDLLARNGLQLPTPLKISDSDISISQTTANVNPSEQKNFKNFSADADSDVRHSRSEQSQESDKQGRANGYTYDELVAKQDMHITLVTDGINYTPSAQTRRDIVERAIKNAASVGYINENGNAVVHVNDMDSDVIVSKNGVQHGLDRRLNILAPVTVKVGEILQNAIRINEMNPRAENIKNSYILVGCAKNQNNIPYVVEFVVNRYTNEVTDFDVLYSVNGKDVGEHRQKSGVDRALAPGVPAKADYLTDSTISVSQLLDFVNRYFPDILPEDVLRHYGRAQRPNGTFSDSVRYSKEPDAKTSPRRVKTPISDEARAQIEERAQKIRDRYEAQIEEEASKIREKFDAGDGQTLQEIQEERFGKSLSERIAEENAWYQEKKAALEESERLTDVARERRLAALEREHAERLSRIREEQGALDDAIRHAEELRGKMEAEVREVRAPIADADQSRILTRVKREKISLAKRAEHVWDNMILNFTDDQHAIIKEGKRLGVADMDARANYARAAKNAAQFALEEKGRQVDAFGQDMGPGLSAIFRNAVARGEEYLNDFYSYLLWMHHADRIAQDKTVMGDYTAAEALAEADKLVGAHVEFRQMAEAVWKYSDNLMTLRVQLGLVSPALAKKLRATYPHYVPTMRADVPGSGAVVFRRGNGAVVDQTIKIAHGSTRDIMPLIRSMALQTMQTYQAARFNELVGTLVEAAEKSGGSENVRVLDAGADASIEDVLGMIEGDGLLPEGGVDKFDASRDGVRTLRFDPVNQTVQYWKDGKRQTVQVSREIFHGLKAFMPRVELDNVVFRGLEKSTAIFKNLVTSWDPLFIARNFLRDVQEAFFSTGHSVPKFAATIPAAWKEILTNGKYWQEYQAAGGLSSSIYDYYDGVEGILKRRGTVKRAIDYAAGRMEYLNMLIEQGTRLTEFMLSRKSGASLQQALLDAAEVTTNFSRGGTATRFFNRTFMPFLNPSVQGWSKMLRGTFGRRGAKKWLQLILRLILCGFGAQAINDLVNKWSGTEEAYNSLPISDRENYFIFVFRDGMALRLPKNRYVSAITGSAIRAREQANGTEYAWEGYGDTLLDQLSPVGNITRNLFSPFNDIATNTTWYGSAIEGQALESLAPSERYDNRTSSIAIRIGKLLDYSPKKIHYLIDQYSGVFGDFILPLTQRSNVEAPLVGPLKDAFVLDTRTRNRYSSDFYDKIEELTWARNDGDLNAYLALRYLNNVADSVSEMYGTKNEIEAGEASREEKKKQVDALSIAISGMQKAALETAKQYEKAAARLDYAGRVAALTESETFRSLDAKQKDSVGKRMADYYYKRIREEVAGTFPGAQTKLMEAMDDDRIFVALAEINRIEADTGSDGKAIPGSRKKKVRAYVAGLDLPAAKKYMLMGYLGYKNEVGQKQVFAYINGLDASRGEKYFLLALSGYKISGGKQEIYNYINGLDLDQDEKKALWSACGY